MHWGVFLPWSLLQVFATLFPGRLSLRFFFVLFFCYDRSVPIFCSKMFLSPSHPVVGMFAPILSLLSCLNFLTVFWNILFYLYCLVLSRYLFSLPSFASTFWLISLSCIFHSSCHASSASSEYIFFLYFSIFTCCRSFLICDFNLSSHTGFDFLFVVSKGTSIFSKTNLAPE